MVAPTSFFADYGCHVRILEEARVLQSLGHRVTIVTYAQGRDLPDVTTLRTPRLPWHADYEVGSSRHKFAFDAYLGATMLRAMWQVRPDIVHGHLHEGALIGYPLACLFGVPLVFDYQGSLTGEMLDHGFIQPATRWERLARWGEMRINGLADRVVTSSARAARQYSEATTGRSVLAIPDVVNPHIFHPATLTPDQRRQERASLGIPPDAEVIVYLGLLAPYQGTDHLLQAMAILAQRRPQAHLLLMGYPNTNRYRDMARALGLEGRVTLTGRVPYEDAPRRLALGDVAVSPKLSTTEGAGKLLNYMAMALPTVAFDTPVSREYLGEAGLYAAAGDSQALADALATALTDAQPTASPNQAVGRGQRLREHVVRTFPWEGMGHALLEVYTAALEGRRQKAEGGRQRRQHSQVRADGGPSTPVINHQSSAISYQPSAISHPQERP